MGDAIRGAAGQAWRPFVLVAGLLLVGAVVEADGVFAALGARIERMPGGSFALLSTLLGLEAVEVEHGFRLGLVVVPLTMAAALGVLALTAPGAL